MATIYSKNMKEAGTILLDTGLIEIREVPPKEAFEYASGLHGPGYVSVKDLCGYPEMVRMMEIIEENASQIHLGDIGGISGIVRGGVSFADYLGRSLSERRGEYIPLVHASTAKKERGQKDQILGIKNNSNLPEGSKILVVEDLNNTGGSTRNVIEAFQDGGYEVPWVITVLDYGRDSVNEMFDKLGVERLVITNLPVTFDVGIKNNILSEQAVNDYKDFLDNSVKWNTDRGLEIPENLKNKRV